MGGEPTFVSIDDLQADEWNTAAVGPTKRVRADELVRRLRQRFAPHGLLHYGEGKWYPGESLPRWAFALYWRKDGAAIWNDPDIVAREGEPAIATAAQAERLIAGIARNLGVDVDNVLPAYEDPAHFLLEESGLPVNVDALDPKIEQSEERSRMVRTLERGLTNPVGYVLPVQPWNSEARDGRWRSERWQLRRGKLFLAPGDSPVGLRLPLGSLPSIPPADFPFVHPQDPTEPRPPLPTREELDKPYAPPSVSSPLRAGRTAAGGTGVDGFVRTALTVELRDGILHVFMPPVPRLEDYLALDRHDRKNGARKWCKEFASKATRRRSTRAST